MEIGQRLIDRQRHEQQCFLPWTKAEFWFANTDTCVLLEESFNMAVSASCVDSSYHKAIVGPRAHPPIAVMVNVRYQSYLLSSRVRPCAMESPIVYKAYYCVRSSFDTRKILEGLTPAVALWVNNGRWDI